MPFEQALSLSLLILVEVREGLPQLLQAPDPIGGPARAPIADPADLRIEAPSPRSNRCLLYTSDAADE